MTYFARAALLAFALDQVTKLVVVWGLNLIGRGQIDVFPPFLVFRMGWNTGINFGLFGDNAVSMRWVLVALALGISTWLVLWARKGFDRPAEYISAGFIVGGALGNALDRVLYGAVADFLNMSCCGLRNPYSFNVADIFIFAGAVGLIWFHGRDKTP